MKVNLAGFNIDAVVLGELAKNSGLRHDITPEVISASYARISRDPRPIDELRSSARAEVEKTRKSNKNIIFQMGHHSIAEHAVFNFDIIGISRLAIESVEKHRLCSFTEKSQRYITLENEVFIPDEIADSGFKAEFLNLIAEQNAAYKRLFEKLNNYMFAKHKQLAEDPKQHSVIEGWAKEDARYVTALATPGQLGLTVNARNLELMFRRFASSPLAELRALGKELYGLVQNVAPSVILFVEANEFDRDTYNDLREFTRLEMPPVNCSSTNAPEVSIVHFSKDGDLTLLASLLYASGGASFAECLSKARGLAEEKKRGLVKRSFKRMKFFDSVLREFEYPDITFEISLSAACFAQMKRHRMATITAQNYDPALGVTLPDSIREIGEEKLFFEVTRKSGELYEKLLALGSDAAVYCLTNAHRRRILIKTNARELYHIARLRQDAHAQWDIARISALMVQKAKEVMPYTFLLACGKDKYDELYNEIFS